MEVVRGTNDFKKVEAAMELCVHNAKESGSYRYGQSEIEVYGDDTFKALCESYPQISETRVFQPSEDMVVFAAKNKSSASIENVYVVNFYCDLNHDGLCHVSQIAKRPRIVCENGAEYEFYPDRKGGRFLLSYPHDRNKYNKYEFASEFTGEQPKHIGTLTDSKLHSWELYLRSRFEAYNQMERRNSDAVDVFLSKMKELAEKSDSSKIGNEYGTIKKGIHRLNYKIDSNKRISCSVELDRTPIGTDECVAFFTELVENN